MPTPDVLRQLAVMLGKRGATQGAQQGGFPALDLSETPGQGEFPPLDISVPNPPINIPEIDISPPTQTVDFPGQIDIGGPVGEEFIERTEQQLDELPIAQPDRPRIEKLPFEQADIYNPPAEDPFEQQVLESRASPFLGPERSVYSSEGNRFIGPGDVPENINPDPASFDVAPPPEGDAMKIFISNLLRNQQTGEYPEDIQSYLGTLGRSVQRPPVQLPQTAPPPIDPRILRAGLPKGGF